MSIFNRKAKEKNLKKKVIIKEENYPDYGDFLTAKKIAEGKKNK